MAVSFLTRATLALAAAALVPAAALAAPLHVIATIVARPGQADAVRAGLVRLSTGARNEDGCLGYVLYEDREHAGTFYTDEVWRDDAALDAHLSSPAMKAAAPAFGAMLAAAPVIARLKPL